MHSPDPDSACFAVGVLKKVLNGSRSTGLKAGTVKDFVVEKHLTVFRQGISITVGIAAFDGAGTTRTGSKLGNK